MADISKITTLDGITYDIKDAVARSGILQTKTFTDVIGTANNWANATFFFGKVQPTDFYVQWQIRFRIYAEAAGRNDAKGVYDVTITGTQSNYSAYSSWNSQANTSYRPIYYTVIYRALAAGISAGYGHALGVRLYSSWNATTAANARTIRVDILECINCTFTFYSSMTKYANIPGSGATNYTGYTEFDAVNNGLREAGDDNTTSLLVESYSQFVAGTNGMFPYTLVMQKPDGTWESIVTSSSVNTKSVNTNGFLPGEIRYMYTGNTYSSGSYCGTSIVRSAQDLVDLRYSFNGVTTSASTSAITVRKPLYLVGTITNGLFYVDTSSWFSHELPSSANGKVYIYLGYTYDAYRSSFYPSHTMYAFINGSIHEIKDMSIRAQKVTDSGSGTETTFAYSKSGLSSASWLAAWNGYELRAISPANITAGNASKVNNLTVQTAVPANAVFTDTNTHRPVKVNGTEVLGNNTTALNLIPGSNVSITNGTSGITIAATDTTYSNADLTHSGLMTSAQVGKLETLWSTLYGTSTTLAVDLDTVYSNLGLGNVATLVYETVS